MGSPLSTCTEQGGSLLSCSSPSSRPPRTRAAPPETDPGRRFPLNRRMVCWKEPPEREKRLMKVKTKKRLKAMIYQTMAKKKSVKLKLQMDQAAERVLTTS